MIADTENKRADTDYKRGLLRFEPRKLAFAAFGASAAFVALSRYSTFSPTLDTHDAALLWRVWRG